MENRMKPFEGWAYTDGARLYTITSSGFRAVKEREALDAYRRLRGEPVHEKRRSLPANPNDGRTPAELFG